MRIAVATEKEFVSGHFGHCEGFTMYDIEKNDKFVKNFVQNPGHKPGFLPVFLNDLGVTTIISGGMGERAQELFAENSIEVVVGASGLCDDLVNEYIKGNLKSTGSVCREHEHEGNCGE